VDGMLLATDLDVARDFYGNTIGLDILIEDDQFLTFKCGGGSRLVVTKSTTGTADEATQASWRVEDIAAEVSDLCSRDVQLQEVSGLHMVDSVADVGFALAAWFVDPQGNSIGLLQFKEPVGRPAGGARR
ncbi:MAG: VOC family protein, partial [Solirubrobacteraceae bacterium]